MPSPYICNSLFVSVVLFALDSEDNFAGINHVELGSCNALDVRIVFAEFLLGSDLLELILKFFSLCYERSILSLKTLLLLSDVGIFCDAEDTNDNAYDQDHGRKERKAAGFAFNSAQDMPP